VRRLAFIACGALIAVAACGSSPFTLASPSVDASYSCLAGSTNVPYDLHATANADNPTSQNVEVRSVSAVMVVAAIHGVWQQKVGFEYDAGQVQFSPRTIAAGAKAQLLATIPSACSNGKHLGISDDYADYAIRLTVVTSAGTFKLTSVNMHRILAP
jgi:hypothetical protein